MVFYLSYRMFIQFSIIILSDILSKWSIRPLLISNDSSNSMIDLNISMKDVRVFYVNQFHFTIANAKVRVLFRKLFDLFFQISPKLNLYPPTLPYVNNYKLEIYQPIKVVARLLFRSLLLLLLPLQLPMLILPPAL